MAQMALVYRRLEEGAKRLTPQRECVLKIFLDRPGRSLSADEVHQLVREQFQNIGMATVYRTLEVLTSLQILQQVRVHDGRARYEVSDAISVHRQAHLICMRCGRSQEVDETLMTSFEQRLADQTGFQVADHEVNFYGTCATCVNKGGRTR